MLSDNKDLALVRDSNNTYLLSKDITEYSSDSVGMEIVGLTNGALKTGEKFVADIYDANTSSSSRVKKLYTSMEPIMYLEVSRTTQPSILREHRLYLSLKTTMKSV